MDRSLNEGRMNAELCGKSFPGKKKSKCTGPEAGWCLVCVKNSKKANGAGAAGTRAEGIGNGVEEAAGGLVRILF